MQRPNNNFGVGQQQRPNNNFGGGQQQRPNNNFGGGQQQRPNNNYGQQRSNFAGPPHKDNNFALQQQMMNSSYNQAFPPLGAPGGNR